MAVEEEPEEEQDFTPKPLVRRTSTWLPSRPKRQMTGFSMAMSVNPAVSSPGNPIISNLSTLSSSEEIARDKLISYIVADDIWKGTVSNACAWYARLLQSKFVEHWHLFVPALVGLKDGSKAPRPNDLAIVFEFMYHVAKMLKSKEACALTDIVDELGNDDLLKDQLDEERAIPNQIVFAAIGWLTMLYEPASHPAADKLEITPSSTSSLGSTTNASQSRKYRCYKQGFDHVDAPLYKLLVQFGNLIPGPRMMSDFTPANPVRETIKVQYVCFATLQQLASLRIIWVSSLALHLELDSNRKTLKLFQFPSFCRMMTVERKSNLLTRLLNDHAERSCEDVKNSDILTDEFFEEILLTYRLVFGQDERSWRAFLKIISTFPEDEPSTSTTTPATEKPWTCDPLLATLCGKSCTADGAKTIYEEIDAGEVATHYDPHTEFPFFGKRLLELQEFVKVHRPQNLGVLLSDKSDMNQWYQLWSNQLLVFFATFTIFLMLVSLIFQIWQVVLAKEQLAQPAPSYNINTNPPPSFARF